MNGIEINKVLQDVHQVLVAAGLSTEDASELFLRGLISNALVLAGKDRDKTCLLLEEWLESAKATLTDPTTRLRKARNVTRH